ncbi:PIG-L deacetylase family protein [Bacteroidota bacterium]
MNHKILALAAHPDDIEFSCGASIHKLNNSESIIKYVVFSPCTKSLLKGQPDNILFEELEKAATHLNIKKENIIKFNFPVREFPKYRQEILEELIKIKKEFTPDLVFIPNSHDIHQDHKAIHEEGVRAFKNSKILGYEMPWNNLTSTTNFFIKISKEDLEQKIKAIKEYKTQNHRIYKDEELFAGLAKVRGVQANCELAEAFELIKWHID